MGDKTHVGKLVYFHLKEENKKRSASTQTKTCPSLFSFFFNFISQQIPFIYYLQIKLKILFFFQFSKEKKKYRYRIKRETHV